MPSIFQAAATRAGLTLTPPDAGFMSVFEISGQIAGHVVRVHRDPLIRQLRTEVYLQSPLDLGLRVHPAGQPSIGTPMVFHRKIGRILGRLFGAPDLRIGDVALDDAFDIHGDEEGRVGPLLEEAREALLSWYESGIAFDIDDAHVSLRRYWSLVYGDSPDSACADLDVVLDLARKLEAARASLPIAAALAPSAGAFRSFADRHHLSISTTPLAVWGALGPLDYWAHAVRLGPGSFEIESGLRWPDGDRRLGGAVRRATSNDGERRAPTGDVAFDAAFVVEGAALVAVLPPETRAALVGLAGAGHAISLTDHGLHLRAPLGAEPYALEESADRAAAAIRSLEAALRSGSAYR